MDKTACTQINEGQGDSKDFRIKLLYRVCGRSDRAGFSEQYEKLQESSKMNDKKDPLLKQKDNNGSPANLGILKVDREASAK